jgi:hypothetical protein
VSFGALPFATAPFGAGGAGGNATANGDTLTVTASLLAGAATGTNAPIDGRLTRGLTQATAAAVQARVVRLALLADMAFASGPLRLWTGIGDLDWSGTIYTGAGGLVGVSEVEEATELRATTTTLTLAGVSAEMVDMALADSWQGRAVSVYLALFDETGALIIDPITMRTARMDQLTWTEGGTVSFALTLEDELADISRVQERRYTDRDQQGEFPGDRLLEYVVASQRQVIRWGTADV